MLWRASAVMRCAPSGWPEPTASLSDLAMDCHRPMERPAEPLEVMYSQCVGIVSLGAHHIRHRVSLASRSTTIRSKQHRLLPIPVRIPSGPTSSLLARTTGSPVPHLLDCETPCRAPHATDRSSRRHVFSGRARIRHLHRADTAESVGWQDPIARRQKRARVRTSTHGEVPAPKIRRTAAGLLWHTTVGPGVESLSGLAQYRTCRRGSPFVEWHRYKRWEVTAGPLPRSTRTASQSQAQPIRMAR